MLRCGTHRVSDLADRFGTPLYLYDLAAVRARYRDLCAAFKGTDTLIAYSVKANGNLKLLSELAALGAGADIVSQGELHRCLKAGMPADRIVFAGTGKTREEMRAGLEAGIYAFNVESRGELEALAEVADGMGRMAPVALRLNPDIVSPTPHEYTRTGHARTKFGIPADEVVELYRWAAEQPSLAVRGVDVHIGSQILEVGPYLRALDQVLEIAQALAAEGIGLEFVDLGGGYGVPYDQEERLPLEELAALVAPRVREAGLRLVLEPGRYLVGEAGLLVTRVLYVKRSAEKTFVITDGGMTELIRPSHYQGFHRIEPVELGEEGPTVTADIVGPICEAGDFLGRDRDMALPDAGELLAVRTAGAYGFAMASNYNARPRPAEVVVDGDEVTLARARESLDDLLRGEWAPDLSASP